MELRIELYMLPGTGKSKTNFLSDHLDRRFLELLAFFFFFFFQRVIAAFEKQKYCRT